MEAGPRYLEGTTVGSGRDIIGVRRDRIADIISTGREIISRAKSEKLLPDTITGATAALLVTIAGYGEPLSEGQWRELAGVVGGIMRDNTYADLARLRTLITQEQFLNVARNQGYARFIRRLDDGRWVCELAPKLEDLPDECAEAEQGPRTASFPLAATSLRGGFRHPRREPRGGRFRRRVDGAFDSQRQRGGPGHPNGPPPPRPGRAADRPARPPLHPLCA